VSKTTYEELEQERAELGIDAEHHAFGMTDTSVNIPNEEELSYIDTNIWEGIQQVY
jgi:hypothetical protein